MVAGPKQVLGRIHGHIKGIDAVREVVTACRELGIKILTLYAFSVETEKAEGGGFCPHDLT